MDIKKAEIFRFEDSPKSKPQSEDKYFEANKPLTPTIDTQKFKLNLETLQYPSTLTTPVDSLKFKSTPKNDKRFSTGDKNDGSITGNSEK